MRIFIMALLAGTFLQTACKKSDVKVAAYMRIEGDTMITTVEQGANTRLVPYVTVYQNDNPQGTYEPPGTYPIIGEGPTSLAIRGHIRRLARNGFYQYTLYEPYTFNTDLKPNETFNVRPIWRYRTNTKIVWAEYFDDPSLALRVRRGEFDTLKTDNDPKIQLDNTSYGVIKMKPVFSFFELESSEEFTLPRDQRDIYLELDYNCNIPFSIGLIAIDNLQEIAVVSVTPFATDGQWRKGYVFLTDDVMGEQQALRFRLLIRAQSLENFTPVIYLENMRLMHLE